MSTIFIFPVPALVSEISGGLIGLPSDGGYETNPGGAEISDVYLSPIAIVSLEADDKRSK